MIAVTKFALPHLNRGSSIINTTSATEYKGSAGLRLSIVILQKPLLALFLVDYSSTKGAIVSFTRSLSVKLAPQGIRVNAVAPGPVITAPQAASREAEEMESACHFMDVHDNPHLGSWLQATRIS